MQPTKQTRIIDPEILKVLLYALGGYILYNRFFGKKAEDVQAEAAASNIKALPIANNPLQTETYKPTTQAKPGTIFFRTDKTNPSVPKTYFIDAARDIKNAFGLFNDDEAAIVRAFKKALTKQEINLISRSYSALYKTDLFFDISNRLNIKELEPIYSYILKLPETIPGKK